MKAATKVLQTPKIGLSQVFRQFSSYNPFPFPGIGSDGVQKSNSVEPVDDFDSLISDSVPRSGEKGSSFYRSLDKAERAYNPNRPPLFNFRNKFGPSTNTNFEDGDSFSNDVEPSFTTAADGMDAKLKEAANYFGVDDLEIENEGENYSYRPDVNFDENQTYSIKDLDIRKPAVQKPRRNEFETTTKEVLEKADFRNVAFLANFITESGIINKRSMTKISAKAQRKVARAIKTARAFGLMPFTTMGTKPFVFDRTMENMEDDFKTHIPGSRQFFDRRADNFGDFNFVKPEPGPGQFARDGRMGNSGYHPQNFVNTEPGPRQFGNNARTENFGPFN